MKTYTIKQGNNSANGLSFKLHFNLHQLNFKAKLSNNCLYHFPDIIIDGELVKDEDNWDINKVYGVTWGLTNDKNSFRIGWNCQNNNGMIQYFAYMHVNGKMESQYLFEEFPEVIINFHIDLLREEALINVYRLDSMDYYGVFYDFAGVSNTGYYNFPYFGGNKTAPHLMNIGIE